MSLLSLLMQIMSLLLVNLAASLSLGEYGLGKLALGVHRVLSVASVSGRLGEKSNPQAHPSHDSSLTSTQRGGMRSKP